MQHIIYCDVTVDCGYMVSELEREMDSRILEKVRRTTAAIIKTELNDRTWTIVSLLEICPDD